MTISRDLINTVRERASIEDIVKRYVPSLKKKGNNYLGLCPFHKEKTPSFTVSPDKRIFKCFGCHAGGNVFTFISKVESLNFPESVKFVARIIGIEVVDDRRADGGNDQLLRVNRIAADCFRHGLETPEGIRAREYLVKRGVRADILPLFLIGYAPDSWDFLVSHLRRAGAPMDAAAAAGLVGTSDKGDRRHYYDRFRKRIIFPIRNTAGEVVGFGGRIVEGEGPKYLNSPESAVFKKRKVLYGIDSARESIKQVNRVIIVEGYLDVIGCHQAGIQNVVAPLGTALTEEHVEFLSRNCQEIIILFDADSAGMNASLRSLDVAKNRSIDIRIAALPEADPFEFIVKRGAREFMMVVENAVSPVDFRIRSIIGRAGREDRLKTLLKLFEVLRELDYESERDVYLRKVSSLLDLEINSVRADYEFFIKRELKSGEAVSVKNPVGNERDETGFLDNGYRELVLLLCNYPELVEKAVLDFSPDEIDDRIAGNIFSTILDGYSRGEIITVEKVFDFFPAGGERDFLEGNLLREYSFERPDEAYTEIYINIKRFRIDNKIRRLVQNIKKSHRDDTNTKEYMTELEILRREKEKLTNYVYNRKIL